MDDEQLEQGRGGEAEASAGASAGTSVDVGRVLVYRQARPDPGMRLVLVVGAVIITGFALLRFGEQMRWWAAGSDDRVAAVIIAIDFVVALGLTTAGRFGRLPELFAARTFVIFRPDRLEWRDGRGGSGRTAWDEISSIETVTARRNLDSQVRNLAGDFIVLLPSQLQPATWDGTETGEVAVAAARTLEPGGASPHAHTLQELTVELHPDAFELRRTFPSYLAAVRRQPSEDEPPEDEPTEAESATAGDATMQA